MNLSILRQKKYKENKANGRLFDSKCLTHENLKKNLNLQRKRTKYIIEKKNKISSVYATDNLV